MKHRDKGNLAKTSMISARPLGFSLLEVLIALLVLSIGLIGVAVLSIQSLQNVHSSLHASIATAAALDLEERLWLKLGDISDGCPHPRDSEGDVKNDFLRAWSANDRGAGWLALPGFSVAAIPDTLSAEGTLAFSLSWTESRFGGADENFSYRIGILCRL